MPVLEWAITDGLERTQLSSYLSLSRHLLMEIQEKASSQQGVKAENNHIKRTFIPQSGSHPSSLGAIFHGIGGDPKQLSKHHCGVKVRLQPGLQ